MSDTMTSNNQDKKDNFYTSLVSLFIVLNLFGYEMITSLFWRYAESNSRLITTPYRVFMLLLSVLLIILPKRESDHKRPRNNEYLYFCLFITIYSGKVLFDLFNDPIKAGDFYQVAFNYEIYVVLPALFATFKIIDMIDFEKTNNYTIIIVLISLLSAFVSARKISAESIDNNRVSLGSNLILNTISLGHLGASGVIITFVKWPSFLYFNKKILLLPIKIAVLLLSLIVMVLAAAKGPIISLISVIIFYLISSKRIGLFIFATGLYYFFFNRLIAIANKISPVLYERVLSLFDSGDEARSILLQSAMDEFWSHPLGGGYFMVPYQIYSHNMFVDCLMTWGVLGLIIFVYLSIKALYNAKHMLNSNELYKLLALLFVSKFVASNMSGTLYLNSALILLFLIVLYFGDNKREEVQETETETETEPQ